MTTTPTQLPVPSEKPQDLKFNAGKIDEFVTSMGWTYTDRLNVKHYTIEGLKHIAEQAISAFGYITMDSFEDGATLTLPNQVLRWQNNGEYYRWDGIFPKVVAPGSTPNTVGGIGVGAWVGVGDASLRANLISNEDGMGGSLVRLTSGETVQGFVNSIELYASDFGFTGVGDETAKWKLFCQEMRSKVLDVSIGISGEGILADNTSLRAIHGCGITLTGNVTGTTVSGSEAHCLVAGNNSTIDSVVFNGVSGTFYNGAGILIPAGKTGVEVLHCKFTNTSGIPVKFYKCSNCKAQNNHIEGVRHGIMWWLASNIEISGNAITKISHPSLNNGGGIWGAVGQQIFIHNNSVSHCADVGIDIEGGRNCFVFNNYITHCRNGEIAIFGTGTEADLVAAGVIMGNIIFSNNNVDRYSTANDRTGIAVANALTDAAGEMIYGGLDVTQDGALVFERNHVRVLESSGNSLYCHRSRTSNASGTAKIIQRGCVYETVSGRTLLYYDRQDREIYECELRYKGTAANVISGELRDMRSFMSRGNLIDIERDAVVTSQVFTLNNSQAVDDNKLELDGWTLRGPAGTVYFNVNQTSTPRTVIIGNMNLDDSVGLTTIPFTRSSGFIEWKNQKIRLLRPGANAVDFSSVAVFYQSDFDAIDCHATLMLDGDKKSVYRFALKCDAGDTIYLTAIDSGGAAGTGLWPNSACYATFSGTTLSFTNTGSQVLSAMVELNLNSM